MGELKEDREGRIDRVDWKLESVTVNMHHELQAQKSEVLREIK